MPCQLILTLQICGTWTMLYTKPCVYFPLCLSMAECAAKPPPFPLVVEVLAKSPSQCLGAL